MEYKYKAFISYRHIEPDMQAAERLQKLLEAYRPPKSLGIAKENWRIFRDVSELQSSSDLSEIIKNAIETSEFLIVICSPKYTESKWCMQELTRFRELHGNTNENIITLMVNGEPKDAFPKELTYTEVTTTNEKGEEVKVKVEVEPLAANIVANDIKESMKKLNTEYLRIAAPLLGCDFNDLFQREKRREAARRRRIFGGVSGILSLITIISVASAVTINGKNARIEKQNSQIKAQNEQIESKNNELLVENAGHLAVESENLYKESSLIPAIKKAVSALPANGENKPVLPEAEYALSKELGMFQHTQLVPQLSLKHDCAVEKLSFMGGGKSVVTQDATGVYFWDAETGRLIKKISANDSEFLPESGGSSNKLTTYFDISPDKTGTYYDPTSAPSSITYENSSVFNKIYTYFVHSVDEDEPGTGGDVYLYNSDSTVWRLDGATGEVKWKAPRSENAYSYRDIIMDEEYILRIYQDKNEMPGGSVFAGNNTYLEIIDRETGNVTDTAKLDISDSGFGMLMDMDIKTVRSGVVYIYSEKESKLKAYDIKGNELSLRKETEISYPNPNGINSSYIQFFNDEPVVAACSILAFDIATEFTRYDKELGDKKWSTSVPLNYQNKGKTFLMPAGDTGYEHDVLAVVNNRSLAFIDYENGSLIKHIPFDSEVVDVSFSRSGLVMFTVSDGEEYAVSLGNYTTGNDSDNAAYRVQTMNTKVSLCSYSRGKYVTAENYSNTAYIQYNKLNPMYTDIDTGEFMYNKDIIAVSDDGSLAAVTSTFYPDGKYKGGTDLTRHLFIYETAGGKCTEISQLEDYRVNSAAFAGSKLIVNANKKQSGGTYSIDDTIICIDTSDGSSVEAEDAPKARRSDMKLVPVENGAYYLADSEKNIVFVSTDGSVKSWAGKEEGSYVADKEIINGIYAVNGSKAALYAQFSDSDGKKSVTVHDFAADKHITLDCDLSDDAGLEIQRIFWQNSSTVGVLFSNRTVSLFDAGSGKLMKNISLNGTSQEPVSAAAVSDETFAVLCRDSCLYEMNSEGFTGRSCRLDFSASEDNDIYEYDVTGAALLETKPSADKKNVYAVWEGSQAWLLDTERFTVRYRIDNFAAAPSKGDIVFISDDGRSKAGFFPIYTTQQLIQAAKDYLLALDEA